MCLSDDLVACRPEGPAGLTPTIFHEPWWLNTASKGQYEEVDVSSDGRTVGRLPFLRTRHRGFHMVGMPMLTHFLGPALENFCGSETARLLNQVSITQELIRKLPPASEIYFKHHRGITDTVAFQALGFETDTQFTVEIAPAPPTLLWQRMRAKTRNAVRRAEEHLEITEIGDPELFLQYYAKNLEDRRLKNYYDMTVCRDILTECLHRGVGRILIAKDALGRRQAGIVTIWDHNTEYYLMSTRAVCSRNGAVSLLLWSAIQHAANSNTVFDFDGISKASDATFFRGFGGKMASRHVTYLRSTLLNAVSNLTGLAKRFRTYQTGA